MPRKNTPLAPPFVIVFVQGQCPACHEFMPRFARHAAPYAAKGVRVFAPDVSNARDKAAIASADAFKVQATPTLVAVGRSGKVTKLEGAVSDAAIIKTLALLEV